VTASATATPQPCAGLLGDTSARNYSHKLQLFNTFAEPELRQLIRGLGLRPGMRVLDAGCGTGEALNWLLDEVGPTGTVVGLDLAAAHVQIARQRASPQLQVVQGDLLQASFAPASFDFIWCVNTINHLHDPVVGVKRLSVLLRPGGRIALGQSSLLPDMYFAWDSRLERLVNDGVRQYYRERYRLDERDLASVRSLVGVLRQAQVRGVSPRTVMIERVSPVDGATEAYLVEGIFRATWGERMRPYLSEDDYARLAHLCDPWDSRYALKRQDFHFLQSFTLAMGEI
jgi:SAM-dependent methyltransferase